MVVPEKASPDSTVHADGMFATTHWSVVLAAGHSGAPDARAALDRLCQIYWPPLYAFLRRYGRTPEDAEDGTRDFFAHFLEKERFGRADPQHGRFRTFLLTCLKHYLRDAHDERTAVKRGGRVRGLSLDRERAERGYAAEPVEHITPERVFEKRWASTLLENVLAQLGDEFARTGKREFFDQLKGFVWGEQGTTPVRQIATQFGVSESAVKVTVHRLRQRFRELLRLEIAHIVTRPEEIDDARLVTWSPVKHRTDSTKANKANEGDWYFRCAGTGSFGVRARELPAIPESHCCHNLQKSRILPGSSGIHWPFSARTDTDSSPAASKDWRRCGTRRQVCLCSCLPPGLCRRLSVLDGHLVGTGARDGVVKLWSAMEVRTWWPEADRSEVTPAGTVAWRGTNLSAADEAARCGTQPGEELRLYVSSWDNPRPDVEVTSLDVVSREADSAPFILAITVE